MSSKKSLHVSYKITTLFLSPKLIARFEIKSIMNNFDNMPYPEIP